MMMFPRDFERALYLGLGGALLVAATLGGVIVGLVLLAVR